MLNQMAQKVFIKNDDLDPLTIYGDGWTHCELTLIGGLIFLFPS